jgi:hypothetical protein
MSSKRTPSRKQQRLTQAIDDDSIVPAIERWKEGKTKDEMAAKAWRLIKPLIGYGSAGLVRLREQREAEMEAKGMVISLGMNRVRF